MLCARSNCTQRFRGYENYIKHWVRGSILKCGCDFFSDLTILALEIATDGVQNECLIRVFELILVPFVSYCVKGEDQTQGSYYHRRQANQIGNPHFCVRLRDA